MTLLLIILCAIVAPSAQDFAVEITKVIGTAQIKREGSRKWEKIKEGASLADNDILQTSFKSNIEVRLGKDNLLFLGSGSRTLLNILPKAGETPEVTFTVFSGSIYSRITSGVKLSIYTSTALAKTEKGIFNSTADEATGLSGFHVFSGSIAVGNISLKSAKTISGGRTTIVGPGEDPSDPKKISAKQMAVLTGFYGSEFINQEIEATGVEIESEGDDTYRPAVEKEAGAAPEEINKERMPTSKAVFDFDAIMKKMEDHDALVHPMYSPISPTDPLAPLKYFGTLEFSSLSYGGKSFSDFRLRPGIRFARGNAVLNLPYVADSAGHLGFTFQNARAMLDKIYSADIKLKRNYLHLGDMDDFTLGNGLIMENYTNRVRADNVRDLGAFLHLEGYLTSLDLFSNGLAENRLVGLNFGMRDTNGYFGLTLVREGNPLALNGGDLGFRAGVAELSAAFNPDSIEGAAPFFVVGTNFSHIIFHGRPWRVELNLAAAGLVDESFSNLKGWGVIMPDISVIYGRSRYAIDLFITRNRFIRGIFDGFYEDNRLLLHRDSASGSVDSAITIGGAMAKKEYPLGIRGSYSVNPMRGISFSARYEKVFKHFSIQNGTVVVNGKPVKIPTHVIFGRDNGNVQFRLCLGRELSGKLPWAEAYYEIDRVGYFSKSDFDAFEPNTFTDYGFKLSYLIYSTFTLTAAYESFYNDANGDGRATPDENVTGFSGSISSGF